MSASGFGNERAEELNLGGAQDSRKQRGAVRARYAVRKNCAALSLLFAAAACGVCIVFTSLSWLPRWRFIQVFKWQLFHFL